MATLTTGFVTYSTAARAGNTFTYANPTNASASDDTRTSFDSPSPPQDGYTNYLTGKELVDKVPVGSTINGIQLVSEAIDTDAAGRSVIADDSVRLYQNNALAGTDKSDAQGLDFALETEKIFGGVADLWGLTWIAGDGSAANDINGTGFGAAISYIVDQTTGGGDGEAAVDYLYVVITYTPGARGKYLALLGS